MKCTLWRAFFVVGYSHDLGKVARQSQGGRVRGAPGASQSCTISETGSKSCSDPHPIQG